ASATNGYHNTYLFCEYLVSLVHLKLLADKIGLANAPNLDFSGLLELIRDEAIVVANRVAEDGRFRYLIGEDGDRSAGQVGLYTLQYVLIAMPDDYGAKMTEV